MVYLFLARDGYVFLVCYALVQAITALFSVYGAAIIGRVAPDCLLGLLMFVFNTSSTAADPRWSDC